MNKNYSAIEKVLINNEVVEAYRINNDVNGNPRYVVHFLSLGLKNYEDGRKVGLKKYRGKWFGGGYVIQSYNIQDDLNYYTKKVKELYQ